MAIENTRVDGLPLRAAIVGILLAGAALGQPPVIVDHTCTDLDLVPPEWIAAAKALTIHYAHTSHGSQVCTGALVLEDLDPFYSLAIRESSTPGLPAPEDPPALRMYDGTIGTTYVQPPGYWSTEEGCDKTRTIIATGEYAASMFAWCGELSWADTSYVQTYLDTMAQFAADFPAVTFILHTGHTDGSGSDGTLNQRNQQIRDFALAHGMALLDLGDIEAWDPDGVHYLDLGCTDSGDYSGGNWCDQWCAAHPGDPRCTSCGCAHSRPLICNLKGRAFWWLMARLAGWAGPGPAPGDLNCDGSVNAFDVDPFALALVDPSSYADQYPDCDVLLADINEDGAVNVFDIDPFVELLAG